VVGHRVGDTSQGSNILSPFTLGGAGDAPQEGASNMLQHAT
jgi:hypothetical protein